MASLLLGTSAMASQVRPLPSALSFSKSLSGGLSLSAPTNSSLSASAPPPNLPLIYCGRGDKKTARGKRFKHSFGNARPRNKNKGRGPPKSPCPPSAPKKDPYDDGETVEIQLDEE